MTALLSMNALSDAPKDSQESGERSIRSRTPLSLLPPRINCTTRRELQRYFANTWSLQELLFRSIVDETAYYTNPDPLRNLLIFYLGHPAVFYVNKLIQTGALRGRVNQQFEAIFAEGVDPERPEDILPTIKGIPWPSLESVWHYRNRVFETVNEVIDTISLDFSVPTSNTLWALLMSVEHDRIHFETSSMIIRQLPVKSLRRPDGWEYARTSRNVMSNSLVGIPAGTVTIGKQKTHPTFGWDNEYGRKTVHVEPFLCSKFLLSNGEFKDFCLDGGYQRSGNWSADGWRWRLAHSVTNPRFWLAGEHGFRYRAMFDEFDLPLSWPVEVNYHEAEAYCRWKGSRYRLPTEAEWNRLTDDHELGQRHAPGGDCYNDPNNNVNLRCGSPRPVDTAKPNSLGVYDAYGNVWQWLSDDFYPLPGFEPLSLYPNFSAPYFGEKHKMLAGGAWATIGTATSKFYRLWFRKNFYQHAGFRLVSGLEETPGRL